MRSIAVVGASLAGLRAVEELRQQGYDGRIDLIGAEEHLPYDRPPLSKQVLQGMRTAEELWLRPPDGYDELQVELHLGRRAVDLDLARRVVTLDDGPGIEFDGLIIATGALPRRLPIPGIDLEGVFELRTLDDALALRAAFERSARVVVVGAGFIGAEVASSARCLGLDVTLLEALPVPLTQALGPEIGAVCAALHRAHGVVVRCGVRVASFEGAGQVEAVRLADGTSIAADVVVVGVGVAPATEWLQSSTLTLRDGIVCDETCAAVGAEGVYAAGDAARIDSAAKGQTVRVEHWTNASDQGAAAAANLLRGRTDAVSYDEVPYFWSDQHGAKLQFLGSRRAGDEVTVIDGSPEQFSFAAAYTRNGRLVGCVGVNRARVVMQCRALIAAQAPLAHALAIGS
jgi:NADPH-dependent 2,4-dienoyl-CoA reductase/sulfur reductase-like enzyme